MFRFERKLSYVIWTKRGYWPPTRFHTTLESATAESMRLASKHPDRKFQVLLWIGKVSKVDAPEQVCTGQTGKEGSCQNSQTA